MQEVLKVINQIANTSSRKEKEVILKQHKDNELLKDVFYFAFNPYILTGLSTKKITKKVKIHNIDRLTSFEEMISFTETLYFLAIASAFAL